MTTGWLQSRPHVQLRLLGQHHGHLIVCNPHGTQSLVLAPLFVWMELLFLGGYRPRLQAQLRARIEGGAASQGAAQKGQKDAQKEALLAADAGDRAADSASTD